MGDELRASAILVGMNIAKSLDVVSPPEGHVRRRFGAISPSTSTDRHDLRGTRESPRQWRGAMEAQLTMIRAASHASAKPSRS
jgi:hypothetical protein